MHKRYFVFLIMIIVMSLLSFLVLHAQTRWSIWVYQAESGRLLHVEQDGSVSSTDDIAGSPAAEDVHIAPQGDKLAYLSSPQEIVVKDLKTGAELGRVGLSDMGIASSKDDRLLLGNAVFDEQGTVLVYGEISAGFGWQIHVLDLSTGKISHTIHYNDTLASNYPSLHAGVVPIIQNIHGDTITFSIDEGLPVGIHSYHWFYSGDILSETVAASTLNAAAFPYSDDLVTALFDENFAADNEDFRYDFLQRNVLDAYVVAEGRFPFFAAPQLDLKRVWFIQGGERLLVQAYVNELTDVWVIVGRDGSEIRRQPVAGTDIFGTPDGFVYVTAVESQTAVVQVNTRSLANAGETLWLRPGTWRIVWAGDNRPETSLETWTKLGHVQVDPSGLPDPNNTPTIAPSPRAFREVGMEIQVFVQDGYLNLRDAPSTNSNVLSLLESGARGVILDGPVDADGFVWWKISIDNRTGWVVESLDDGLALIPPQLILTRTPTPSPTP